VCGNVCPSGICSATNCFDPNPTADCALSCALGKVCFRGQCLDGTCAFQSFNQLCGAVDGTIGVCCGDGSCGHLLDDPQNCGACGIHCPAGQTCADGTCSGSPACGPGHMGQFCNLDAGPSFLCCPGYGCINTSGDPANCGACGNACASGTACHAGACS
jgi:hypothetical protein